jgi:hypothetical protein
VVYRLVPTKTIPLRSRVYTNIERSIGLLPGKIIEQDITNRSITSTISLPMVEIKTGFYGWVPIFSPWRLLLVPLDIPLWAEG